MSLVTAAVTALLSVALAADSGFINCGTPRFDPDENVINSGGTQKIGRFSKAELPNTIFDYRYRTQREMLPGSNSFTYVINVDTPGIFSIMLSFCELRLEHCSIGSRTMNIIADGRRIETGYDIFRNAGSCNRAVRRSLRTIVGNNRRITLEFQRTGSRGPPTVSSIQYSRVGDSNTPTPARPTPRAPTTAPAPAPATCEGLGIVTRKDIRDMSTGEWNAYVAAFRGLSSVSTPSGVNQYEFMSQAHVDHALHNQALFVVWHRVMLWELDKSLNRVASGVRQPYFDWSTVSSNVWGSSVMGSSRLGGDGQLTDGGFAGLRTNIGGNHVVTRSFDRNVQIESRGFMNAMVATSAGFNSFRTSLESAHNAFHVALGGDMISLRSPNDPAFYAHHAFIDKVFRDYELRGGSFSGAALNSPMQPWGTTAAQALGAVTNCVRYQSTSAANRVAPTPSKGSAGYQAAVDEAEKAKEDAVAAAITFGASPAQAAEAAEAIAAINAEMGLDLSDAQ